MPRAAVVARGVRRTLGVLAFGALVGVYYASTAPIDWHLGTSADRVVFSIVLGLAIMAPMLAGRVWEDISRRSRESSR